MEGVEINWIGIFLFAGVSIGSIIFIFIVAFSIAERKNPLDYFRKKSDKKVNSGAKFG
tara:strand:+ start:17792 stop:17965 length:174 start_codon:yes stop_codon:yes gene_type:complete